jgi:hypothetical protein
MRKSAVDEQMGAALVVTIAQSAGCVMRPSTLLQVVGSKASSMHHKPHKEFALHGSLRSPDWFGTGEASVGHEKKVVGRLDRECAISRPAISIYLVAPPLDWSLSQYPTNGDIGQWLAKKDPQKPSLFSFGLVT